MAKPLKKDVVAELEKAGIKFDPTLKVDDLIKLLPPKGDAPAPVETPAAPTAPLSVADDSLAPRDIPVVETPSGEIVPAAPVDPKKSATVVSKNGQPVRTYNATDHGKDFRKLAEGYAGKIGGSVR